MIIGIIDDMVRIVEHLKIDLLILATCVLATATTAFAAPVTWTGGALAGTGTSLINNDDTLVKAHNVGGASPSATGPVTIGGVTF